MTGLFDIGAPMPIISMWRPWANWVALGWKGIESRKHKRFACLAGMRIGIQASDTWDKSWLEVAGKYLTDEQKEETKLWVKGLSQALICTAFVPEHRRLTIEDEPKALIECSTERYGLILQDLDAIVPIKMAGRQGIWREHITTVSLTHQQT